MRVVIDIETGGAAWEAGAIAEFQRVMDYVKDRGKDVAAGADVHVGGFAADANGNRIATWEVTA